MNTERRLTKGSKVTQLKLQERPRWPWEQPPCAVVCSWRRKPNPGHPCGVARDSPTCPALSWYPYNTGGSFKQHLRVPHSPVQHELPSRLQVRQRHTTLTSGILSRSGVVSSKLFRDPQFSAVNCHTKTNFIKI